MVEREHLGGQGWWKSTVAIKEEMAQKLEVSTSERSYGPHKLSTHFSWVSPVGTDMSVSHKLHVPESLMVGMMHKGLGGLPA